MRKIKLFLSLLMVMLLSVGNVWATDPVDELTASDLTATSTTYADFSGVAGENSDAVYAGNSAKTSSGGIQLRSKNSNSGIVSTTSGGVVKSVKITVESGTNTIDVYGSNTAYTAASDLYGNNKGTLVGSLTATGIVTFTDEYAYVGIRSNNGALYLSKVEITWTSAAPPTYTITAESNNTTYGTVSLSGSVITGSPNPGYRYADPAYSVSPANSATVNQVGDAFTVTPSANTTVTVNFEAIPQHTVTWNNNGVTSTSKVYEGEKPVFPATPTSCDATSTTFIGWATDPWTGKIANLNEKTVYTSADAMPAVSGAVTYYAVFAKVAGESGWIETAIGNLGASDVFVFSDGSYALNNNGGASNAPTANAITVSAGKITSVVADNLKWNISGNATDGYTFYPNGDSETWLYCSTTASSSSNNNMRVGTGDRKVFEINASGYLVTKDTYTARYLSLYNNADFRGYVGTNNGAFVPKFYKYSAGTASEYMTTCCTKYNVAIAAGIENGSVTADIASACEGTEITLTPSAAGGYHLDAWDVYKTGESATKVTVTANKFNMPAYDVTVSASFVHDDCENLDAPTLNEIVKTYNSANIAWNTVTDAVAYAVSVVKDGESEPVFSGNVTELSKALENLEPETQYNYTIMAVGDGTVKCADGNGVLEGNFTTEALPTAVLTLMENGNEVAGGSHAITVPFALPTAVTHTCGKTFVGWTSKSDFADGDEELSSYYEKGAEFTFENTTPVTLYAVYADETPGAETKVTDNIDLEFTGVSGTSYVAWASSKTGTSGAVYTGVNAGGNSAIQFRSDVASNKPASGLISTTSGGKAKKITITWNSNTAEGRTLNVFGSNTAYTEVADLVDDNKKGTLLGTVVNGTSTILEIAGNYQYIGVRSNSGAMYLDNIAIEWAQAGEPSYTNYSTTCAAAPTAEADATDVAALVNVDAAGTNGTVAMTYTNVNPEGVAVALFNDEACTQDFDGDWLEAEIAGDDKHIAYTIDASTSYKNARTAYIKLTAPETTGATAPAVVIIPVSQVKKPAVFASLAELAAADLDNPTNVTVTLTNEVIKEIYIYNNNRRGLVFNVQKDNENVKIYFNADVPAAWVAGGKVSGTLTDCPWKIYSGAWQLAPSTGFVWDENLTYTAPPAIESIEIRGNATQKTYIDGQVFNPAGLSVIAIYDDNITEEDVTEFATWTYNPAKLSESDTEVTVTATYNEKSDDETVTGLTVNPIPNKTIAEFITAGGTRCYLEGIVGTIENTTYGNFYLEDASGTIYVYGCLTPSGESKKFAELGVEQGDQIKVIAEAYTYHNTKGDEAVNVVFVSKVSAATIDIDDIDMTEGEELLLSDIVATITPDAAQSATINYEVTEGTAVTISEGKIIANAEGEATITASIAEGTGYLAGSTTFTVTVSAAPTPVPENTDIITAAKIGVTGTSYAAWEDKTGFGTSSVYAGNSTNGSGTNAGAIQLRYNTATDKQSGIVLTSSNGLVLKGLSVTVKSGTNTLNIYAKNTAYDGYSDLYSSDEDVRGTLIGTVSATGAMTLEDGVSYDDNYQYIGMRSNNGALYLTDITITWGDAVTPPAPSYTEVRNGLNAGEYYTMCLDKAVTDVQGGTIWRVVSKAQNGSDIILEEVEGTLDAGRPYIFFATATTLEVVYEGAAVGAPITEGNNGLIGSFSQAPIDENANNYIIYNNALYVVNSDKVYVGAHRAYLNMGGVPPYSNEPQQGNAPRRRVTMAVHGSQVATGIDALNTSDAPVKVLINGQLFILRGEKMYNVNGQLVK